MNSTALRALFLLSALLGCCLGAAVKSPKISSHPVILVVSYDGFRYDYFDKVNATPWMSALKLSGVSVPYMQPAFPTKTFPNHQSIATGLFTETHGIVDNTFFDPELNDTLGNEDAGFWNYNSDVLPIWIRNEMAGEGRVSGCLMWPGSSFPYGPNNDLLPTYYFPGYNPSVSWEDRVDTVISWITNDTNPANLVFLYYDEPDSRAHAFGPNSQDTLREVEKADNRTGYLISKLVEFQLFDDINLIMLSDHGMQEVTQRGIIYLETLIDEEDLVEVKYGGTPVVQLVPREGKGEQLHGNLTELSSRYNFTVLTREERAGEPFYYQSSRRTADFVVLADPGFAFDDFNASIAYYNDKWGFNASDTREYGVHGYNNEVPSMRAYFTAHGPAFKNGFEHPPIKNVDVVPLISTIVGIPQPPSNGSLERVEDMIDPSYLANSVGQLLLS